MNIGNTLIRPMSHRQHERGFILVMGTLFLVVLTLLCLAMFRNAVIQERIAGNTRDKQRAFEVAQSTLQYGEWWLGKGNRGLGVACAGVADGNDTTQMRVCTMPFAVPPPDPSLWVNRIEYLPPNLSVTNGGGGISATTGDINYSGNPGLYIGYLGTTSSGHYVYQVSAYARGGNPDTVALVQSTYEYDPSSASGSTSSPGSVPIGSVDSP